VSWVPSPLLKNHVCVVCVNLCGGCCVIKVQFFHRIPVCESLQGETGIFLVSPDQKTRGFMVQIILPQWFPERAHQVFGEMPVRI
jgi:hypothetical protein